MWVFDLNFVKGIVDFVMFIIKRVLKDSTAKKLFLIYMKQSHKYVQATTEVSLIDLAVVLKGGKCNRILRIDFYYKRQVWSRGLYIICTS